MMKKENYFKRVKKPISSEEEAKPLVKETWIYFGICIAAIILFFVLAIVVPVVSWLFIILVVISFVAAFYFGFMLLAMRRALKRFKNLHCECGGEFVRDENTTWKEISRQWARSNNSNKAESTLYVNVQISWKCPKCGKSHTFNERLCSGKITVTNNMAKDTIVSTSDLVEDYFSGLIHM